eukprot:2210257-Karenia_brevis.AAC.1
MELLLTSEHADLQISTEEIENAFNKNGWAYDHDFHWTDFETLLKDVVMCKKEQDGDENDDLQNGTNLANLVDAIAKRQMSRSFPLVQPIDLLTSIDKENATHTLMLVDKMETVEIQSYIDEKKHMFLKDKPEESPHPLPVQQAMWNRDFYYVWMRRCLLEKSFNE